MNKFAIALVCVFGVCFAAVQMDPYGCGCGNKGKPKGTETTTAGTGTGGK